MKKQYFVLYKPFGVLSQFTREAEHHRTLGDVFDFPKAVYPVGRLDKDSEGLLVLTNDKQLHHQLLEPKYGHPRTYWVQVEGIPTHTTVQQLQKGVEIRINKKIHHTKPAKAKILKAAPNLPDRTPPIRFRKNIPTAWLELTLTEGKNRQVRRMCAKVGFPVLRLVRVAIGDLKLGDMAIGEVRRIHRRNVAVQRLQSHRQSDKIKKA